MVDPLQILLNEHTWSTIRNTPGSTHHLISLGGSGGGELLDWVAETGHYSVWVGEPAPGATADPYRPAARTEGNFATIRAGHTLTHLADTPGNWSEGNVMDLELATKNVRIYRYHRGITSGDPIPTKVNSARFFSIGQGHTLIYLDHDRVLDWEPATGRARIWNYDRARTTTDPLPTKVTETVWDGVLSNYQVLYLGGDLLLFWNQTSGRVTVWRYDRSLSGDNTDPFTVLEMEDSWAGEIAAGRIIHYLGGDRVLDWDPATGHERIWDFDRPMMAAPAFQAMLNRDIATARTWVVSAQAAIAAYQLGLVSGVHDVQWLATDAALLTHFHAQNHAGGIQAALSAILTTYNLVLARLTTGTSSFSQVSKQQAVTHLGSRAKYTRGYTFRDVATHLTPSYRPFDTIGNSGLDGAGDKLRAAIIIHETVHFVGNNPDSATEWEPGYATLTAEQAVTNPSSYAAFAHHILTNHDLRFGNEPWN
ncbi:hypothetical protein [Pseudarthrobacter sulfonivorans]|uniref:hypothetical protein n=1 Tax=Pseudarthrobacter sulfonivorans TaxID=121292 RepID=UPI002864CB19|nr:hypothetical protein [Pseudarthrobacter sulfonivorans]MDR6413318.1 hypothetical protein [Pseudarthrobacter sulfonivorans]